MATEKKVLSNAFSQALGKVLTVLASLVVVKIVSGFGTEFYGNYLTSYEFLAFFGILADAGLFAIAVREISKYERKAKEQRTENREQKLKNKSSLPPTTSHLQPVDSEFILGNIFSMRLLLIVTVTILAGVSVQFIPSYPPVVKIGIWITGLSMALTIVAGTLSSILQARMKIQYFSGSLVVGKILLAGFIFWISRNAEMFQDNLFFTMLWAGVASNIIFCGLVTFFAAREIKIRFKFNFDWWRETFQKSLPYGLSLVLQTLYLRLDVVLISILLGSSAVGIYGISTRILESFLILGVFFGQAILPKISAEEGDQRKVSQTLSWGMEKLLIFSLPIVIGTVAFAPEMIQILSSDEFLSSAGFFGSDKILMLLVPTVFFAFFNQLFSFTLVAANRQNYLLKVNATALGLNGILNLIFLPMYGIIAAAVSTVFCEVIVLGLLAYEIKKYFSLCINPKALFFIILASVILLAEIYLTPLRDNLILAAAVGSFSYFGVLFCGQKLKK